MAKVIRFPVERRVAQILRQRAVLRGPKYLATKDLSVREVAALVRADLRADPLLSSLAAKAQVRIRGTAIDVQVRSRPEVRKIAQYHAEAIRAAYSGNGPEGERYCGETTWQQGDA